MDTFEGFLNQDSEDPNDSPLRDTSEEAVAKFVGGNQSVVFRKDIFPIQLLRWKMRRLPL